MIYESIKDLTSAANAQTGRIKKVDAQKAVVSLALGELSEREQSVAYATLYNYFVPSKPKNPKGLYEWVYTATGIKDVRAHLNELYVKDGKFIATDGARLHIAPIPEGEEWENENYYNLSKHAVKVDRPYPQIERVIPADVDGVSAPLGEVKVEHTTVTHKNNCTFAVILTAKDSRTGEEASIAVDKRFWEQALQMGGDITVGIFLDKIKVTNDKGCLAVVMYIRNVRS